MHYINVTKELPLDDLQADEIPIILETVAVAGPVHHNEKQEAHVVYYGNVFKVTFKSSKKTILKVEASRKYWKEEKANVLKVFGKSINPSATKIASIVVFTREELRISPFKWNNCFQLGNVPDGNIKPEECSALHPCLFQYKILVTGLSFLDAFRRKQVFRKTFLPLIPMLRQYCNTFLEYNNDDSILRQAWAFCDSELGKKENQWVPLMYLLKPDIDNDAFFSYSKSVVKQLPIDTSDQDWPQSKELSKAYIKFENLPQDDKEQYLLGCEWFNKAITTSDKTNKFLFIMIMFEIFLPNDSEQCESCGQQKFSVSKRFKTYIQEVIGEGCVDELGATLGQLYSMRSMISHRGKRVSQDFIGFYPLKFKDNMQVDRALNLASQFLVSWLFYENKHIQVSQECSESDKEENFKIRLKNFFRCFTKF